MVAGIQAAAGCLILIIGLGWTITDNGLVSAQPALLVALT